MSRKNAREYVFKLVFEYLFNKQESFTLDIFLEDATLSDLDRAYIGNVVSGVEQHYDELMAMISKYAKGFSVERMFKPDLAALLTAVYEMKYIDEIPMSVSISECVELVKRYSTEKSNSYVNGILASIYKELEAEAANGSDDH